MCETMFFFQCLGMCQPLDSAMPGRPPIVPFFGWERYAFMFLCEKIVPVDMALVYNTVMRLCQFFGCGGK